MTIENFKEIDDTIVLNADNYINKIEGEKLENLCSTFLTKGIKKFIIDFSATDIVNSIGISILIGILEKVKHRQGVLLFSGLKKANYDIFNIVGLVGHIPVLKTEEEALTLIKGAAKANQ